MWNSSAHRASVWLVANFSTFPSPHRRAVAPGPPVEPGALLPTASLAAAAVSEPAVPAQLRTLLASRSRTGHPTRFRLPPPDPTRAPEPKVAATFLRVLLRPVGSQVRNLCFHSQNATPRANPHEETMRMALRIDEDGGISQQGSGSAAAGRLIRERADSLALLRRALGLV
jgi:hypothetical protein